LPNRWLTCASLPAGPRTALAALHLSEPSRDGLAHLDTSQWRQALDYCARHRLTLPLRHVARDAMPPAVRDEVDDIDARYRQRLPQFSGLYADIHRRLTAAGLEFVALKGMAAALTLGIPISRRVQYDLDLYLPREAALAAQTLLTTSGWSPVREMEAFPTDHLPVLLPKTDWQWRGDLFDVEMPIPIELHFRFWAEEIERLRAPGVDEFWTRRRTCRIEGVDVGVLSPPDALAYAALHLLKHILRGSVKAFHVYEIACVLQARADDEAFWAEWTALHSPELRRLESVIFRLAQEWFGCPLPAAAELPAAAGAWFESFALSPATQEFHPNKDHLWLHIALLDSPADAWRVARRRLLPGNLPPRAGTQRGGFWQGYFTHTARRVRHHAIALPRTALSGVRFWWRVNSLGRQFWLVLAAAALFNFPLFIFFLHYNLFLLDLGFREDFVGVVNSAQRFGGMAGTIPAALVAQRFGLRRTLMATVVAAAVAEVLRAVIGARMPLAALAFSSGAVFAVWAVLMAPLVAGAVGEKRRAAAFSIFFASLIGMGVFANWLGGALPSILPDKRTILLLAGGASALAVFPALRLQEFPRAPAGSRVYPRSRFLVLFLVAFAVWHLATGLFNPLNNVYLRHAGFSDRAIGGTFAVSQAFQVIAMLLSPLIIRRFGLLNGIVLMMAATAAGLGALAAEPVGIAAASAFILYMAFQWMSEPGLNTLLMNRVDEREHSGASALNYVVAFGAQALAAYAGGVWVTRFGYGPSLTAAATLAVIAGLLFRALLRPRHDSDPT
jgi:predicted MFS family arabinose efflux permease